MAPVVQSFRQRLVDLAGEHEELQKSFSSLKEECEDLRAQLAAAKRSVEELQAKIANSLVDAPLPAIDDVADLPRPDGSESPLRLREVARLPSPRKGSASSRGRREESEHGSDRREGNSDRGSPTRRNAGVLALRKQDDGADDDRSDEGSTSYSSSSSATDARRDGGRRKRKNGKTRRVRKGSVKRRHRRREKSRGRRRSKGRSRSGKASRSRSRRGRAKKGEDGSFGTGDHRHDLDSFISKNQLEARVAHALRTMGQADQKKVMGTDGGENSFLLLDRVKSPNAVVMSRIRKLEARNGDNK